MATAKKPNQKIMVKDRKTGARSRMIDTQFTRYLAENGDAAANWAGARHVLEAIPARSWRGEDAVPVGSPVADLLEVFERETDLPLELPLHSFYFYLATYLLSKGVKLEVAGRKVSPQIWTVVLAPSGCGKSFSLRIVSAAAPVQATITGIASGAKMIDAMAENEAAGQVQAMVEDEFAQFLKGMENAQGPLADAKKYMLLSYDGGKIERSTKGYSTVVNDSRMCVFGANVDETFYTALSMESMLDGLAQRFCYVIAERDPNRVFYEFPNYNEDKLNAAAERAWARVLETPIHENYSYAPEALQLYNQKFREFGKLIESGKACRVSFFRRLMQNAHKLALLIHVASGDGSPTVSKAAMVYALRQTRLHIIDTARLIAIKSPNDMGAQEAVADLAARFAAQGKQITARDVRQNVWAARQSSEAAQDLLTIHQHLGAPSKPTKAGQLPEIGNE